MTNAPIVLMSDPHFHNWKAHAKIGPDGRNTRLVDGLNCLEQAAATAKHVGAANLIIAGDTFHVRGVLRPSVFTEVASAMARMVKEYGMSIYLTAGNHDQEYYRGGATGIDTLSNIEGVHVFTRPLAWRVGDARIGFVPYFRNVDDFKEAYLEVLERDPIAMVIHQGIDGMATDYPIPPIGVSVTWLNENTPQHVRIFTGHYHVPKHYRRFTILGAPYQQTFADEPYDMGFWVWYPGQKKSDIVFHGSGAPKFLTLGEKVKDWSVVKGNIVRFKVKTAAKGELLCDRAMSSDAVDAEAIIHREFVTAHDRPITISTPEKMFDEFLTISPKYLPASERLKKLFREVCLPGS